VSEADDQSAVQALRQAIERASQYDETLVRLLEQIESHIAVAADLLRAREANSRKLLDTALHTVQAVAPRELTASRALRLVPQDLTHADWAEMPASSPPPDPSHRG
jgi:hypothetical protein